VNAYIIGLQYNAPTPLGLIASGERSDAYVLKPFDVGIVQATHQRQRAPVDVNPAFNRPIDLTSIRRQDDIVYLRAACKLRG
jgi:hypothetical protein